MNIYALNIADISEIQKCLGYVFPARQLEIQRIRDLQAAKGTLLGEMLLKALISEHSSLNREEIELIRDAYGKPALSGQTGFEFNLSHSGSWVVCAVDREAVGIDVQKKETGFLDIARHYYSETEYRALIARPDAEQMDYFYELWTLKESYLKYIGRGLNQSFEEVHLSPSGVGQYTASSNLGLAPGYLRTYDIDPDYKLAVCSSKAQFPESVVIKDIGWIQRTLKTFSNI